MKMQPNHETNIARFGKVKFKPDGSFYEFRLFGDGSASFQQLDEDVLRMRRLPPPYVGPSWIDQIGKEGKKDDERRGFCGVLEEFRRGA